MIVSAPSQLRSVATRQQGHAQPCGAAPALCGPPLGIQGYNDTRTTDESPERVALIKQATPAYLRTSLASTTARGLPRVKPWPRLAAEGSG